MSQSEKAVLECSECGNQFDAEIWTKINVENQDLNDKLYADKINVFECRECGNIAFVCYPIQIIDKRADERAIVIPLNEVMSTGNYDEEDNSECNPAFFVVEIKKKKPRRVFYSLNELKFEIHKWTGEPLTPYGGPPEKKEIEEGLKKKIINKEEAERLRNADWNSFDRKFMEGESDEEHVIDINDEEDEILDLYFRLVLELERSKTVVHYRKGKR